MSSAHVNRWESKDFMDFSTDLEQPELHTERLTLEPITEAHAQELYRFFSDPKLHQFTPSEPPALEQQKERCIKWARRRSPDGSEIWLNWAARDNTSGNIAAHIQVGIKEDSVASIGYVVSTAFQRNGIATEALEATFQYLKKHLGVREVRAWSDTRNIASHALVKKLGMVQIDYIQNADFFNGETSDEFVFSKIFDAKTARKS